MGQADHPGPQCAPGDLHLPELLGEHAADSQGFLALLQPQPKSVRWNESNEMARNRFNHGRRMRSFRSVSTTKQRAKESCKRGGRGNRQILFRGNCREGNDCAYRRLVERREVLDDLRNAHALGQTRQDGPHGDASAFDNWLAGTDSRLPDDIRSVINGHETSL